MSVPTEPVAPPADANASPAPVAADDTDALLDSLTDDIGDALTAKPEDDTEAPSPSKAKDDDKDTPDEETTPKDPAADEGDDTPADTPDDADKPDKPEAKNAAQNRIRDLVAQTKERDAEIARLRAQQDNPEPKAPPSLDDLVAQVQEHPDFADASITEIRREARMRRSELQDEQRAYDQQVQRVNSELEDQSFRVMKDFPLFDPNNKSRTNAQAAMADQITALYEQVSGVTRDSKTGQVNGMRVMPHDFFKSHNDAYEAGIKAGQAKRMAATAKNSAAVEAPSKTPPAPAKSDPFMDALDDALRMP